MAVNVETSKKCTSRNNRKRTQRKRKRFNAITVARANFAQSNDCVLDRFSGSGSVLVRPLRTSGKLNITSLRVFAVGLPEGPLKSVLLSEIDGEMDVTTFLARYPVWLRLARMKKM